MSPDSPPFCYKARENRKKACFVDFPCCLVRPTPITRKLCPDLATCIAQRATQQDRRRALAIPWLANSDRHQHRGFPAPSPVHHFILPCCTAATGVSAHSTALVSCISSARGRKAPPLAVVHLLLLQCKCPAQTDTKGGPQPIYSVPFVLITPRHARPCSPLCSVHATRALQACKSFQILTKSK